MEVKGAGVRAKKGAKQEAESRVYF